MVVYRFLSVGHCCVYLMHSSHRILSVGDFSVYLVQGYHRILDVADCVSIEYSAWLSRDSGRRQILCL